MAFKIKKILTERQLMKAKFSVTGSHMPVGHIDYFTVRIIP